MKPQYYYLMLVLKSPAADETTRSGSKPEFVTAKQLSIIASKVARTKYIYMQALTVIAGHL